MKKKMLMLICFILLFLSFTVFATGEMTYNEAIGAIRQSIQAWYMRGSFIQYNSSKTTYHIRRHPEEATIHDTFYSVCSGFTNYAWMEAFGYYSGEGGDEGETPAGL